MFNQFINQLGSWPYLLLTLLVAEFLTMLSFLTSSYYWGRMVRKEPQNTLFRSSSGFGLTFGGLAIAGSGFLSWALAGGGLDGLSLEGIVGFILLVAVSPCFIYYIPFRWYWVPFVRPLSHLIYGLAAALSYWLLFNLNGDSGENSVEFLVAMWACHLYVANSWEAHGWAFVENSTADKGWIEWLKSFTGVNRQSFIGMFWMWHFYFIVGGLIATHFALSFVSDPASLPIPVALYLSWLNEIGLFSATLFILLALSLMLLTAHTETIRGTREIRNRALAGRAVLVTTVDEQRKTIESQVERLFEAERENLRNQQSQILMSEMHDGIGGALVSLQLMMNQKEPDWAKAKSQVARCIDELRHTIVAIDPEQGQIAELLSQLRFEYCALLQGMEIHSTWDIDDRLEVIDIPPAQRLHLSRILQEALTNVIKHSGANRVDISARIIQPGILELSICDNGTVACLSPDADGVRNQGKGTGVGLRSMRARAEAAGFLLSVGPRSGQTGFDVRCRVPVTYLPVSTAA